MFFTLKLWAKLLMVGLLFAHSVNAATITASTNNTTSHISGFELPNLPTYYYQYQPNSSQWTFSSGAGISDNFSAFTAGTAPAPAGSQVLFLQSTASATRSITVNSSGFYRVRYMAALRQNMPNQQQMVKIEIDNVTISQRNVGSGNYKGFKTPPVYLTAGTHQLIVSGTESGDNTVFVDEMKLQSMHDWQNPSTWNGGLPGPEDEVKINQGIGVVMNGNIHVKNIIVNGNLNTAQGYDVNITTDNIKISGQYATFKAGESRVPFEDELTITLTEGITPDDKNNPSKKHFMVTNGGTLNLHGKKKKSWTKLKDVFGSNQIEVEDAENWEIGDQIVITSNNNDWENILEAEITGISNNILTLNVNVSSDRKGSIETYTRGSKSWVADMRPEVGMLTHNIKIQGDAASDIDNLGGHIMIMNDSKAYVDHVELYKMGQSSFLARYPFHWHNLGNGGAGQYFKHSSVHKSFNRAVTIHGTNGTHVGDNFCYDHLGHGIFFEDGNEVNNVVDWNVVLKTTRPAPGKAVIPSDNELDQVQNRTPASFWITNPLNTIKYNIAAGTHGTGFWYALPKFVYDTYGNPMEPYAYPLLKFKGNVAHSCMNGIDIFDQINIADESILPNGQWKNTALNSFDDCLFYANHTAIYTGIGMDLTTGNRGPSHNFRFHNNILVENHVDAMIASYALINESVFVSDKNLGVLTSEEHYTFRETDLGQTIRTSSYRVYDGPGRISNSHFVGWSDVEASLLWNTGAAVKHTNHLFSGLTSDVGINGNTHWANTFMADYNISPVPEYGHANDPVQPRVWSIVIKDVDGSLSGKAGSSVITNHPFIHFENEDYQFDNWTNIYRSDHEFVTTRISYPEMPVCDGELCNTPSVAITRTKSGTESVTIHDILPGPGGEVFRAEQIIPAIVNEDFEYVYQYTSPLGIFGCSEIKLSIEDATVGDVFKARFKSFGELAPTMPGIYRATTLNEYINYNGSCYYYSGNSTGDLLVKIEAYQLNQSYTIDWQWTPTFPWANIDSDGDFMSDKNEIAQGRHPFDAGDLEAKFSTNGQSEGWSGSLNVDNFEINYGRLNGTTSASNPDAMVYNNSYNFSSAEVDEIEIDIAIQHTQPCTVELYYKTNTSNYYSADKKVQATYPGIGNFETLTFDMQGKPGWNGVNNITGLRIDPIHATSIPFIIDNIKAIQVDNTPPTATSLKEGNILLDMEEEDTESIIYPNPTNGICTIQGLSSGATIKVFNIEGKLLLEEVYAGSLDLSTFPKGVYSIVYEGNSSKVVKY